MNIFVLDKDPYVAAVYICDKHCPKMVLESAQILCSPFEPGVAPYRRTHYNHPCCKWVRYSRQNYEWMLEYSKALCVEYTHRFKKVHKSQAVIMWCQKNNLGFLKLPDNGLTEFAQAMHPQYMIKGNPVSAYKHYYIGEKARFAQWQKGREKPSWWPM